MDWRFDPELTSQRHYVAMNKVILPCPLLFIMSELVNLTFILQNKSHNPILQGPVLQGSYPFQHAAEHENSSFVHSSGFGLHRGSSSLEPNVLWFWILITSVMDTVDLSNIAINPKRRTH